MRRHWLTEKNLQNKKFYKSERAIFIAFYKFHDYPTAKVLARRAHIARSTFYRHHRSPHFIPGNYEDYLFQTYRRKIKILLKRPDVSIRSLFLRTLIYIHVNSEFFKVLFQDGHKEIIKRMVSELKEPILAIWNYGDNSPKLFHVYENEILGIIEAWGEQEFANQEIENVLGDILYLTKTSPKHLSRFILK
ncbi:hypothetical protein IKE13_00080 [Candidatus Saccharibacteria bacterium]|nr:hypothetical protein [Candidatus Saccharibacteria bacterium]